MLDTFMGLRSGGWVNRDPSDDYWYMQRGPKTQAGVNVSEDSAMAYVTVYACVAKRAKTIATLPITVVEKTAPKTRQPIEHPLGELLSGWANPESTGLTVRETMMANLDLWGNAYVECKFDNDRRTLLSLIPLMSRDITPTRNEDGDLVYKHEPIGGEHRVLPAGDVWHIPGLSFNGITGLSPIGYNRETIGLGVAAGTMAASFFGNGAWAGGILKRDPEKQIGGKPMTPEAGASLVASLEEKLRGPDKAFGIALLREGMTYEQLVSIPLVDAQFIELRKLQRIDICGIFDVPPSKIHDLENGTFNNVEQEDIGWVKDAILPASIRIEVSAKAKFFPDQPLFLRHNMAGLLRGDFKSQMEGFAIGRQWGIFSINDCLELLDRNPIEDGNDHLTPLNMGIVGQQVPLLLTAPAEPEKTKAGVNHAVLPLDVIASPVSDAGRRIAIKEIKAVEASYKRRVLNDGDFEPFTSWLDKFYTSHVAYFRDTITPLVEAFEKASGLMVVPDATAMAETYAGIQYETIHAMLEQPGGVPALIEKWKDDKAQAIAAGLLQAFDQIVKGQIDE